MVFFVSLGAGGWKIFFVIFYEIHSSQDFFCIAKITTFLAPYRGHSGPSGPKSQKNRKKVAGASRPRGQKRLKKSQKRSKTSQKPPFFDFFNLFFNFFSTFFDPGAERPRQLFFDFFGISGPKGPNDPCKGPRRL